jgi:O-antigen/teichoic acid export membrane protein
VKKIALILSSGVMATLLNFVITALVIRETTEAEASAYIYCFMVGNLVQFFGVASIERLLVRRVHEAEDRDTIDLTPYVWASLAVMIGPFVLAALYFGLQTQRPDTFDAFLFSWIWALGSLAFLPMSYLRARLRTGYESVVSLGIAVPMTALKLWIIFSGIHPKFLFAVFALEFVLAGALALMHPLSRKVTLMTGFRWRDVVETLRAAFPFVVAIGLANIYLRASFVVFAPAMNNADVIVLGVIGQLTTAGGIIPYTLQNVAYPVLQRFSDEDKRLRQLFSGFSAFCVLWGAACGIGLIVLGNFLVHLVYRDVAPISAFAFGMVGVYIAVQTLVNARNLVIMVKGDGRELIALHVGSLVGALLVSLALTMWPTTEGFALALAASALVGLGVGIATPAGRAYAMDMVTWAKPGRLLPALLSIVEGFRQK